MANELRTLCRHGRAWSATMNPAVTSTAFYLCGRRTTRGNWIVKLIDDDDLYGYEHIIITMAAVSGLPDLTYWQARKLKPQ